MTSKHGSVPAIGLPSSAGLATPAQHRRPEALRYRPTGATRVALHAHRPRRGSVLPAEQRDAALLARDHFVLTLRWEMRRADRSGTPLSLVIYRLAQGSGTAQVDELRSLLAASVRETDILGQLDTTVFAVICTDTGAEGVHRFIEKIDAQSGDLPYSVESATYPDHLFEGLAQDSAVVHGPSPLIVTARHVQRRDAYPLKRALDIVGALFALVLFSPVMLVTALLVALTSPGPVIFRQTRLGKAGRPFTFYKFRSMVAHNDDRMHREFVTSLIRGESGIAGLPEASAGAPVYKIVRDPRVTWIGRIIRKTSIDELPQLFNVLKGDMSLVGPRPPLPYEAENYQSWHLRRVLDIQPGMTGLWQVEGRSRLPFDEMVRMDLRYVRSCSLALDLRILAKTVPVVLSCDGAD